MTVWIVYYGLDSTGTVSCVYDNKAAADAHVAHWDRRILSDELGPESVLTVVAHSVQSDFGDVLGLIRGVAEDL